MATSDWHAAGDPLLIRYLLGELSNDEAEKLDELSIADDRFATRLNAVEDDLVDAYAKGEISGEMLDRFRSHYLSSPARRDKVEFAETLLAYETRRASKAPVRGSSFRQAVKLPLRAPALQWGLAAAALFTLFATGYLLVSNRRLQHQLTETRAARLALEEREQRLQRELNAQRAASDDRAQELARVRESLAAIGSETGTKSQVKSSGTLSFVLLAPKRGAGEITTIAIPPGTQTVTFRLELETDDFPRYQIAVKDAETDRIVSQSRSLRAASRGDAKSLSVTISAALLEPKRYAIDLSGVRPEGGSNFIGSYSFRVVIK
ncbi:MAG: hypothetical protein C5B57_08510 [Blastocatellia bacterium]|nr:MAG: hypothetical protein C5B57_08510 [Blastocatellia bacterium]